MVRILRLINIVRPIIVLDPTTSFEDVMGKLKADDNIQSDEVIVHDIMLVWGEKRQNITSVNILNKLNVLYCCVPPPYR